MRAALLAAAALLVAGAASAQERQWGLLVERGEAMLTFATPDAEDDLITLECVQGEDFLRLSLWADTTHGVDQTEDGTWRNKTGVLEPWSGYAAVRSGAAREAVEVDAYQHSSAHGSDVRARIPLDAPIWAAFQSSGQLRVEVYDEVIAPDPVPPQLLKRFFAACG
ncbi:hypothetical protein ACFODL_10960 [Phenylobacterium terrae]|uniref:Uncharacterized protein n=1 Tax=Phenylobacterium terrae TaxID=2665495 RepID=A0ABW4MZ86_9CAUL